MIMLYRAPDATTAALLASELESHGVPSRQSGGGLILAYGDLGHEALQVEIWVPADRAAEAREHIQAYYDQAGGRLGELPWRCSACGEENESTFEVCWRCTEPQDIPGTTS